MILRIFTFIIISLGYLLPLQAQSALPIRRYDMIRYQDDFTFLRQDSLKTDLFDPIKFISLSKQGQSYLSMGGEIRHQYQWYRNPEWDGTVDKNGHFLQRYMFHTDLHLGKYFRFFTQMNSGLVHGRQPGPRFIIDKNELEANQFFVEFKSSFETTSGNSEVGLRIGRMEQKFGTARLIATREGQNVRRSFQGVQLFVRKGKWKLDAFALKQVASRFGVFDDFIDRDELFAGIVGQHRDRKGLNWEPYILLNHDRSSTIFADSARQWRLSPGLRLFQNRPNGFRWNVETSWQWGKFADIDVFAGLIATDLSYQFQKLTYRPIIGLTFSYATGDRDGKPGGISTFETFYPKGVFGQAAVMNPANLIQLHGEFSIHPSKNSKITVSHDQLFRNSRSDTIYDPCAYPVVAITENLSQFRHIGQQTKVALQYNLGLHYFILFEYAVLPPGKFLQEMDRNEVLHYATVRSVFRF